MPKKAPSKSGKSSDYQSKWKGDRRTKDVLDVEAAKQQRLRVPKTLPKPVADGRTAWSMTREELKGFHIGAQASALEATPEYAELLLPFLEGANAARRADALYSTMELERGEFAQRAGGFVDKKRFVETLQLKKMEAVREALGFAEARNPQHRAARIKNVIDGIPSEPTFSRHNRDLDLETRVDRWEAFAYALRDRVLAMPGGADELRSINIDGFHIPIPFTAPRYADDGIVIVNPEYVTAPEAGYLPKSSHGAGNTGFAMVMAVTSLGTPLGWRLGRISDPELPLAITITRDDLTPLLDPYLRSKGVLGVVSTDGNFAANEMRVAVREAGCVENIHYVSHANKARADDFRTHWIPFDGYEGRWGTNGHHEVVCWCGHGRLSRVFDLGADGIAVCRVYGQCSTCGFISVTSGEWIRTSNPPLWAKRDPSYANEVVDLAVGNGLTFNDPLGKAYGERRFWFNEGFHGALVTRFKLGCGKRYFRTLADARLETAMVMSAIYICSIEQKLRAAAVQSLAA